MREQLVHRGIDAVLRDVTLDDKYTLEAGRIYLSGIQALVRLPLVQRRRDEAAGINTAGFISGYRGSPLGRLDEAFWKAAAHLERHHVKFQPGINEDLAATAVWGTQQVDLIGPSRYDGIFAMWYGKGPGVDRCGDVFKHANHAGTSRHGGVILVAGDDHGAYSSTLPHQSDQIFSACMIPVLYPCNVQEYLDLGLHGWAMSRFSGCIVGFKALADTVESSASIDADPWRVRTVLPPDFVAPEGGLNTRLSSDTLGVQARKQEALMQDFKIHAAIAYARTNRLNRVTVDSANARLGIVASGKSYLDVIEALEELGIDERVAQTIGLRLFKVSMPWPLEPAGIREFAAGLEEILVVEEKQPIAESQIKEQLYHLRDAARPRVIGKFDERIAEAQSRRDWLLSSKADFSVAQLARVLAQRISRFHRNDAMAARLAFLDAKEAKLKNSTPAPARPAFYCSGCPHNTSTKTPEGSIALAGIGCHVMATAIHPESNKTTTHMGGEGAPWIGQAPFSGLPHVFANLGDGTYFHSGYLAIRAALAANVNITYKILFNGAVAMTGGQPVDGNLDARAIATQVVAEGVQDIALVTDDLSRYVDEHGLPPQVTLHARRELDAVQKRLRQVRGVSVLIYDQPCAAQRRRRRKKGQDIESERLFINEAVCEGCGDCGVQSNCTSLLPLETEFGRKRKIDQFSCNTDYSCINGFCPSFVTVVGGSLRKSRLMDTAAEDEVGALPSPHLAPLDRPFNIIITGIGGTGVITLGAFLGMAAHIDGKGASVLDMTGMSQKNGSVTSHVRIAASPQQIRAQRIPTGESDLILGCDLLTAGGLDVIAKARAGRTKAILNSHQQPPGQFIRLPDWQFPDTQIRQLIEEAIGNKVDLVDATKLSSSLLGDSVAANMFMLGYAWQRGLIPISENSLMRAVELNKVAVRVNQQAFLWGRRAAVDLKRVLAIADPVPPVAAPTTIDALIERRVQYLTDYQNAAYAQRYHRCISAVRNEVGRFGQAGAPLLRAVVHNMFKLMAFKDEYEVARLYTNGEFRRQLEETFEGPFILRFHFASPLLAKKDSKGRPVKRAFGNWTWGVLKVLAKLKFLRGTALDVFGRHKDRKIERELADWYEGIVLGLLATLTAENITTATEIADLPSQIRGYGHVKMASVEKAKRRLPALMLTLQSSAVHSQAA